MLYSIGYQRLKDVETLQSILMGHHVNFLLDVRSKPYSRKHAFNKKSLETEFSETGIAYKWAGKTLGGFSRIDESHIKRLADWQKNRVACLMCMESDPMDCHRHIEIAKRLKKYGISVSHIDT